MGVHEDTSRRAFLIVPAAEYSKPTFEYHNIARFKNAPDRLHPWDGLQVKWGGEPYVVTGPVLRVALRAGEIDPIFVKGAKVRKPVETYDSEAIEHSEGKNAPTYQQLKRELMAIKSGGELDAWLAGHEANFRRLTRGDWDALSLEVGLHRESLKPRTKDARSAAPSGRAGDKAAAPEKRATKPPTATKRPQGKAAAPRTAKAAPTGKAKRKEARSAARAAR
jgi:hypothetical protein